MTDRCGSPTASGIPCRAYPPKGRKYCLAHDPERHADREAREVKMAKAREVYRVRSGRRLNPRLPNARSRS